jgi:copper(I)-binding protein
LKRHRPIEALAAALILTACSLTQAGLQVADAWARPADAGANSAVYLQIRNRGGEDELLEVRTEAAESASLHRTIVDADGVAHMEPQSEIPIPADETLTFEPGGYHVMLMQSKNALHPGDSISVTLIFQLAGPITIQVPIENR